jgi:hypothetical protein
MKGAAQMDKVKMKLNRSEFEALYHALEMAVDNFEGVRHIPGKLVYLALVKCSDRLSVLIRQRKDKYSISLKPEEGLSLLAAHGTMTLGTYETEVLREITDRIFKAYI